MLRKRRANFVRRWMWVIFGIATMSIAVVGRVLGPNDLWDQTQPRTMAYTVDITRGGSWVLPSDAGGLPATKPPMFNWFAAPVVSAFGSLSHAAHVAPSIGAAIGVCLLLCVACWRWRGHWPAGGRGEDDHDNGNHAAVIRCVIAALVFFSPYPAIKLAGLARPDMLLIFWLTLGWIAITEISRSREKPSFAMRVVLAVAFAGAILTKGPPALLLPVHHWFISRRPRGPARTSRDRYGSCAPYAAGLLIGLLWLASAWFVDSDHVESRLLGTELLDRVVGANPDAGGGGLQRLFVEVWKMPGFAMVRFLPWSVWLGVAAVIWWFGRRAEVGPAHDNAAPAACVLTRSAWIWIVCSIAFFSLSAGKRADYIAVIGPMLAILVTASCTTPALRRLAAGVAALTVIVVAIVPYFAPGNATPGYGAAQHRFARDVHARLQRDALRVELRQDGNGPISPLIGEIRAIENGGAVILGGTVRAVEEDRSRMEEATVGQAAFPLDGRPSLILWHVQPLPLRPHGKPEILMLLRLRRASAPDR